MVPDQGQVCAVAVHVALSHDAVRVIFGDQCVAVVEELRQCAARRDLEQAAARIVDQGRAARGAARPDQPVLRVVLELAAAVVGEIAVEVVAERRPARRAVLVQPVGRVDAGDGIWNLSRVYQRMSVSRPILQYHEISRESSEWTGYPIQIHSQ